MSRLDEVESALTVCAQTTGIGGAAKLARTLAAEVDAIREREIKVSVMVDNEAPFFGAFWSEERDGCFGVIISLKNCAGLAESEEMFAKTVQDTLAHELLHAIQAAYGQMFSETQVREALEDPSKLECAEDSEQMIQQMMNDFMEVQNNLIQARAALADRDEVITKLLAMLKTTHSKARYTDLRIRQLYEQAREIAGRTE